MSIREPNLVDCFGRVRAAFKSLNLEPPDVIILKDREQGLRLLSLIGALPLTSMAIDRSKLPTRIVEHPDGSVWVQAEVMGIKVRWPAQKKATKGGGYEWQ